MDPRALSMLIPITGIIFLIGVPICALAAHFVLRPMVREVTESILALKGAATRETNARLTELEENQRILVERLDRLVEAERFHHQLESTGGAKS
ncbi:MAG: hypothetical protein GWN99_00410 [Gemmatimonadetes bacterium]|uniref:Phage shock protein B n=1 Tax=Candidatus Kutchimonas denitrificans TaxID=3056748 RepID=A0AAE4ZA39_9BACT|nr:hypothetical protein [Gemmatimonadota bacterium]NIR73570.1 hypothetical protein [Candidatus Kutchimonas denitrificans]NIR99529.1 hypothetical protein [Gemmatimonadota bacterium]NIT65149.1 hypothetical protein [Gemmatimonadota bacterium]NIV23682.1 hypothetical protein [Gemmatimonadota bacterium]